MRLGLVMIGGLHPSGREQVVPSWLALVERLARRHEVHAFVLDHLPQRQSYVLRGAHVHDLGRPARSARIGRWAQWRALRAALDRHGPFHLLHGFWADPAGLLSAAAARRLGVPSVVTFDSGELVALDDIEYGLQRTWRGRAAVARASRWATRVHVCSEHMQTLARNQAIAAVRVPLGVDPTVVGSTRGCTEGSPWRLLQVSSLNRVKDHAMLLECVAMVASEIDVHLDLAGDDTLGGEAQRHAERLGIAHRVTFHGFVPNDHLAALRSRAHLYVQSSRHEAAGVAVLEAAAAGLPVVGTRVGYVADWSPTAATAVDTGNPRALADAIVALLRNPARRREQAEAAQRFALEHDADWTAAEMERLYEDLCSD
jgi:glycosyltransferase involved in cell wall biosynthesis